MQLSLSRRAARRRVADNRRHDVRRKSPRRSRSINALLLSKSLVVIQERPQDFG